MNDSLYMDKMRLLDMKTQLLMAYMENVDSKNDEWLRIQIKGTLQEVDKMLEVVIQMEESHKE